MIRSLALAALAVSAALLFAPIAAALKPAPLNLAGAGGGRQYDYYLEAENAYYWDGSVDRWQCAFTNPDGSYIYGCLVNPTQNPTYVWDINDHYEYQASAGFLNPGQSSSRQDYMMAGVNPRPVCYAINDPSQPDNGCHQWSGANHWYGYQIYASAPTLHTEVCFSPENRCFSDDTGELDPTYRGLYDYKFCVQSVYGPSDPALVVVPGSVIPAAGQPDGTIPYGSFPYTVPETLTTTVANTGAKQVKQVSALLGISSDQFFPGGCPQGFGGPNRTDVPKAYDYPFVWVMQ